MKVGSVVTVREHREVPHELWKERGVILEFSANLKRATVQMNLNPTKFADSEIAELKTFCIPTLYLMPAKPRIINIPASTPLDNLVVCKGKKVFILEEDIAFLRSAAVKLSPDILTPELKQWVELEISTLNGIIDRYEKS